MIAFNRLTASLREPHADATVGLLPPLELSPPSAVVRPCVHREQKCELPAIAYLEHLLATGQPLVAAEGNPALGYRLTKRAIDILGALLLLILLAPLLLVVLAVLAVTTRGRPLFWQRRAGHLGIPFMMVKFRTMRVDAERFQHTVKNESAGPVFKSRRDPRITRFGRLLRKTSIDELPQLFHVLMGQMSLVGPRPLDVREVVRFKTWQLRRMSVKPGLTCLWQVSGRSDIGFDDWSRMDLWYVRRQSLSIDLRLLLRTPMTVLCGRGAY